MNNKITKTLITMCCTVAMLVVTFGSSSVSVKADSGVTVYSGAANVEYVADIDNNTATYNVANIGKALADNGNGVAIPFVVTSGGAKSMTGGTLKIRFSFDINAAKYGIKGYICRQQDLQSAQRIANEEFVINASKNEYKTWLNGDTAYYLVLYGDGAIVGKNVKADEISLSMVWEQGYSKEAFSDTSTAKATPLTVGVPVQGFITKESPIDYYKLVVDSKQSITLKYTFDGARNDSGSGIIEVIDATGNRSYASGKVSNTNANKNTFLTLKAGTLEAGTYYIRMSGLYGATTLMAETAEYKMELTASDDKEQSKTVYITTDVDYSIIEYVDGYVSDDEINSSVAWRSKKTVTNLQFTVEHDGWYSVRLTDTNKSMILERIEIKNVDSEAPKVKGAAENGMYRVARTIKFSDNGSGIKTAKINSQKVKSGVRCSQEGKYTVNISDKTGNVTDFVFYIDYTKPKITGVKNGGVYTTAPTAYWSDNLTGIKTLIINDKEVDPVKEKSRMFSAKKEHTIVAIDGAGNKTSIKFTVK